MKIRNPRQVPSVRYAAPKRVEYVRALCDFPLPLTISDLAEKAGVDVSYASRLVEWLSREALLTRAPRGSVLQVDIPQLIRRWAEDYSVFKSNDARSFLDPRGLDNLVRTLTKSRFRYAITGSLAANRIAPIAPARLALIYVDDVEAVAAVLKLRPADAGINVMLLNPFDSVVFERTRNDDQFTSCGFEPGSRRSPHGSRPGTVGGGSHPRTALWGAGIRASGHGCPTLLRRP